MSHVRGRTGLQSRSVFVGTGQSVVCTTRWGGGGRQSSVKQDSSMPTLKTVCFYYINNWMAVYILTIDSRHYLKSSFQLCKVFFKYLINFLNICNK